MYDFIFQNTDLILEKKNQNTFTIEGYRFKLVGEGTFGIVFKIIYKEHTFIAKIMKNPDPEPEKLKNIKDKIDKISSGKIEKLITKYITNIQDIYLKSNPQVIIFEYLDGTDLSEYLKKEDEIQDSEFYLIIFKLIISVSLLHNKLKISHRDLKPQNIFYNPETKKLKLIDFGFACNLNDYSCYNRYQGTHNYIHPRMNNKKINNLQGGSLYGINTKKNVNRQNVNRQNVNRQNVNRQNVNRQNVNRQNVNRQNVNRQNVNRQNIKNVSSLKNNNISRRFPKPRSQDIFSIIIIILKIYTYLDYEFNAEELKLNKFLTVFFSPNIKINIKLNKLKKRLDKKKTLFNNLKTIAHTKITNPLISILLKLIKDYWNFKEHNFIVKKKDISKKVLNDLLNICIKNIKEPKLKKIFINEMKIIYS
jgi:serine/threonine protein kinase